jgi:similar to stage IV sporulation protein
VKDALEEERMKNQWITFFSGYVEMEISGRGVERFINDCVRRGIYIWNVQSKEGKIKCCVMIKDISIIRRVRRKHECGLSFKKRLGLPFKMKQLIRNSGFLGGIFAFFVILFFLSNMIWSVQIKGASPETEELIRKELAEMGVKVGSLQFTLSDQEAIQKRLTNEISSITWVGVQLNGTTFHFQVVEKNEPEKYEELAPRHLVASKKGVVTRMLVETGKAVVQENQLVNKGDILVSGIMGTEEQSVVVPATGVVLGETWDISVVEVPLKSTFDVYTGEEKRSHYVHVGPWKVKVWGFGEEGYDLSRTETVTSPLRFLGWELPIKYEREIVREEEQAEREYNVKEAIAVGKEMARKEVQGKLDEYAKIKGEKVLRESIENGKVKLTILFQVIENIAVPQSIVQGD